MTERAITAAGRSTSRHCSAQEKINVPEALLGPDSTTELCREQGVAQRLNDT